MTAMDAATEVIAIIMVDDRNKNQVPPIATLTAIVLEVVVWSFVVLVDPLHNYDCYGHERSSGF
jgi:hypothetical protein